jgi:MoxR-like ATPase
MIKTADDIRQLNERISYTGRFIDTLRNEVGKIIIGQSYMLDRLLIGLLSNGHVLLEGVPGLAKTLTIKSLSQAIHAKFSRIQFTPDLLPCAGQSAKCFVGGHAGKTSDHWRYYIQTG